MHCIYKSHFWSAWLCFTIYLHTGLQTCIHTPMDSIKSYLGLSILQKGHFGKYLRIEPPTFWSLDNSTTWATATLILISAGVMCDSVIVKAYISVLWNFKGNDYLRLSENLPAYFYLVAQVHWLKRMCAWLEVTDIKVGESVIDEAVHCSIRAVHVLIDQPWDEVRSEWDDKCLGNKKLLICLLSLTNEMSRLNQDTFLISEEVNP